MKKSVLLTLLTSLFLVFTADEPAQAEIIPSRGAGQIGFQAVVLCGTLTVRQGPGDTYQEVKTLKYGDKFLVPQQTTGWAQCMFSDAVDAEPAGWVNSDYIVIDPSWYRTDTDTPVYAWNDTTAPKVALLDSNILLPILKNDGGWLVVSLRGAAGWIHIY